MGRRGSSPLGRTSESFTDAGLFDARARIIAMTRSELTDAERRANENAAGAAARAETLRRDGARTLGENLEQANALIRLAFELAGGLGSHRL